ncbi:MAG: hypothetical protein H7061_11865 [Bdellovibrionaceae bacterium]|nr:hypothetical protein [Bdellovibrio sp.]
MKILSDVIQHYDKSFVAVKFNYPLGYFDSIFSFSDFQDLMKKTRFVENDIWLYKNGNKVTESDLLVPKGSHGNPFVNPKRFSSVKLNEFFTSDKIGIKINAVYDFSEKINNFRKELATILGCEVSVNSYYSPSLSEKMLAAHRDSYNILILQIQGQKKFFFGEMTDEKIQADKETVVLEAGQALYLPANLAHYAEPANGQDSLHLTVGLHDLKFGEFVETFFRTNEKWKLLVSKKFPIANGQAIAADLDYLVEELAICLKDQMKDQLFVTEFLKEKLKIVSDI